MTLLEQIGGQDAVDAIVDQFYNIVLKDDRIKHFFANTDMAGQRNHQKRFVAVALNGFNNHTGSAIMRDGHQHLVEKMGLSDVHFDAFAENLACVMRELGISEELITKVCAILETARNDVLNR